VDPVDGLAEFKVLSVRHDLLGVGENLNDGSCESQICRSLSSSEKRVGTIWKSVSDKGLVSLDHFLLNFLLDLSPHSLLSCQIDIGSERREDIKSGPFRFKSFPRVFLDDFNQICRKSGLSDRVSVLDLLFLII